MSLFLYNFRGLSLKHRVDQETGLQWLASAHCVAEAGISGHLSPQERESLLQRTRKLVLRFGGLNDRVGFRNSALDDFTHTDWEKMRIFNLTSKPSGAGCTERSLFYSEVVQEAFWRLYSEESAPPSSLIHVTCTGYVAPSGAQRLVAKKNWGQITEVLHAYHMGCYASLPAIRMAMGSFYRKSGANRVDIVHTELCTLHLEPTQHTLEQLVIQSLFSDGVIRYSAALDNESLQGPVLEVVALREEILPDSEKEMTWMASDHGMQMGLSREVPNRIAEGLNSFLERLSLDSGMSLPSLQEKALFAIHPGGPRIIDSVQKLLGLNAGQVAASNRILYEYGNMSSATLPHIWDMILNDAKIPDNTWIVSLAFGPGLTISGGVFRKNIRT